MFLDRFQLQRLARLNHPYGPRLAKVLRQLQSGPADGGADWIARIERERDRLARREEPLVDGTLDSSGPYDEGISVRSACAVSKEPKPAFLLYLLLREFNPHNVVELGTNVGISSAYLAAALKRNGQGGQLVTLEASPYRLRLAKQMHRRLGLDNVVYKRGFFAETLAPSLEEIGPVDFAFVDGHHQYQPTLHYFETICGRCADHAILIFDDIRWSREMTMAWRAIQADRRVVIAVDLWSVGLCVTTRKRAQTRWVLLPVFAALA